MEAGIVHFLGRDIHFPRGFGPRRDSSCWFTPGVICSGGEQHTKSYLTPPYTINACLQLIQQICTLIRYMLTTVVVWKDVT